MKTPSWKTWVTADRVTAMKSDDEAVWTEFFDVYEPVFDRALRWAFSREGYREFPPKPHPRVDIIRHAKLYFQEGFRRSFSEFRGAGRFRAWLFTRMWLFVKDNYRIERSASTALQLESEAIRSEVEDPRMDALRLCVDELKASERRLIDLKFGEQKRTFVQVASILGNTEAAASKQFQRIRAALRRCIEQRIAMEA